MFHGKIPPDAIIGDPMNTIHSDKHGGIDQMASVANVQNPSLSAERLYDIADNIVSAVQTKLEPMAVRTITGDVTRDANWGTPSAPEITVIDDNKHKIHPNVTVTGSGVLIIRGDLHLQKGSTLNWNGSIIILGGRNNDAVLKNNQGNLNVTGNVLVLGTGQNMKKSKLLLHDDQAKNDAVNVIDGAILIMSGNRTDQSEKAEFKARHGDVDIRGFIGVVGDKVKFDVKVEDKDKHDKHGHSSLDDSFRVHGGVVVAVPNNAEKHKAKVHLHGSDILIKYNSENVDRAIRGLLDLAGTYLPDALPVEYTVVSWRELPAGAVP